MCRKYHKSSVAYVIEWALKRNENVFEDQIRTRTANNRGQLGSWLAIELNLAGFSFPLFFVFFFIIPFRDQKDSAFQFSVFLDLLPGSASI